MGTAPGRAHVRGSGGETSRCLVALPVFKTEVSEQLGQAGSIPVRLRSAAVPRWAAGVSRARAA